MMRTKLPGDEWDDDACAMHHADGSRTVYASPAHRRDPEPMPPTKETFAPSPEREYRDGLTVLAFAIRSNLHRMGRL